MRDGERHAAGGLSGKGSSGMEWKEEAQKLERGAGVRFEVRGGPNRRGSVFWRDLAGVVVGWCSPTTDKWEKAIPGVTAALSV